MFKIFFKFLFVSVLFSGCTNSDSVTPEIPQYESDTELMMNICQKFVSDEGDIKKLHDAALAVQTRRVIACADYNGECSLYNECVSSVIQASKTNKISMEDRKKLKEISADLNKAVREGREKLKNAFYSK